MKPIDSLREDLQGILATQEYQIYTQKTKSVQQELFEALNKWLQQILQSIFPHTDIAKRTSEWLSFVIVALGLLLLFLLLYLLLSRFSRQGQVNSKRVSLVEGQALTAQRHLSEAYKLAEAGNYTSALRNLFLGSIIFLDQNRWIEAKTWKTNWEYYAELKDRAPQLAGSFYTLAVKFEEALYGGRQIARDDYWLYHNQFQKWLHEGDAR